LVRIAFPVAERPILPGGINETDPNVFFSHLRPFANFIGYPLVKLLFDFGRSTGDGA
jgi:hypothetical protein